MGNEKKELKVGSAVIFYDSLSRPLSALVQIVWDGMQGEDSEPGCNLIVISPDEKREDSYGRQTEHHTSVVHMGNQCAPGYFWSWPEEKEEAMEIIRELRLKEHEDKIAKS